MLVTNVSLRPPRHAIAADIAEAITATDATATGQVVFATLVDDPASVGDAVDAYLGEIMLEAATAADAQDGTVAVIYSGTIAETATAQDTPDASIPPATTTWDAGATISNVTLSGGNLVATSSSTSNGGVRSISYKTTGKLYFELTLGTWAAAQTSALGLVASTGTYNDMYVNVTNSTDVLTNSGTIFSNNGNSGFSVGLPASGDVIRVAVDLTARKAWFSRNGANWNGNPAHDPATGAGGVTVAATLSFAPAVGFGNSHANGNYVTANFGASTFVYAVPSGFAAGWS